MSRKATRKWLHVLNALVSVGVTAGVFGYFFVAEKTSPGEIWAMLRGVDHSALWLFLALSMIMNVLRTWRYDILLRAGGYSVKKGALFLVVLIRGMFVDLLPARLGELMYVYILRTRLGISLGAATTSFALAFVFDVIVLAPFIFVAAFWMGASELLDPVVLVGAAAVLLAAAATVLFSMPFWLRLGYRILSTGRLPRFRLARSLRHFAASTSYQVKRAKRRGTYLPVLGISVLVRLTKYAALYAVLYALVHPMGYGLGDLPVPKVFLGVCSAEMAASLPISGLMSFGAYEGTWKLVLGGLLKFPESVVTTSGIAHHMLTQIYGYTLGLLAMIVIFLPCFRKDKEE